MAMIHIPDGDGSEVERVWLHRPELGEATLGLRKAVYGPMSLTVREREAARMRIARINDCPV